MGRACLRVALSMVLIGTGLVAVPLPATAQPDLGESETGSWLVLLEEPPLASYRGGVAGLAATSPRVTGAEELDVATPASRAYLGYLDGVQRDVIEAMAERLGHPVPVGFRYQNVLNGLSVEVTAEEAAEVGGLPGVAAVVPDTLRELETDVSHTLIGSASFWDGATGPGLGTRGEGVVVGLLDSGVNPFHPSFAEVSPADGYVHENPYGDGVFKGACDPAHPNHQPVCNDKLIGAYNFHTTGPNRPSVVDTAGHGSHVASTIAGNPHQATFPVGQSELTRTIQGVAPRANLISYLVCDPGCPTTAMVAAVNQAIADGVDVLNFSISGADNPWVDPVDRAFLDAFEAGILVSASAGNGGPDTVAKTGPWNLSVAATSHDRVFAHTLAVPQLGDMPAVPGDGPQLTADLQAPIRFVAANESGCTGFPAGAFAGAIALVHRGGCTFPVKVGNAQRAGALAVVIVNNQAGPPVAPSGLTADTIPAVMVPRDSGQALQDLIGSGPAVEVLIGGAVEVREDPAWRDVLGGFSSTGPSQFEVLAPTFAAPGVNILAASAAVGDDPVRYAVLQGTSMASPHGAGAAALLAALHPDWSPARIRSALASTADSDAVLGPDGEQPADQFQVGSGRLDLTGAARVGLVMDETADRFRAANPATGGDPKTLNLPAFIDHACEVCSWQRTVTSVADTTATYRVEVSAPAGMTVTASPSELTLAPGASAQIDVTVDVSELPFGEWVFADIRLVTEDRHRSGQPIAPVHYPVGVVTAAPEITVSPVRLSSTQGPDDIVTQQLTIGNTGDRELAWDLTCQPPWATLAPVSGTVPPGGEQAVAVTFDPTGLPPGVHEADLCLATDDPDESLVTVPLRMEIVVIQEIELAPESLSAQVLQDRTTTRTLTIGNAGDGVLEWRIEAPVPTERDLLLQRGVLLVPDSSNDRVMAFDPQTGDPVDLDFIPFDPRPNLGTPVHAVLNPDADGFLLSDQLRHVVHEYGLDGRWRGVFAPAGGPDTTVAQNIRGIAVTAEGTLLVTVAGGPNQDAVAEFDQRGRYLGNFIENVDGPWDLEFRDLDVLVSADGSILRFLPDGSPDGVFRSAVPFAEQLHGIANGNVLAAQFSGATSGVWELDPAGDLLGVHNGVRGNRGAYELPAGTILTSNSDGVHEIGRGSTLVETKSPDVSAHFITHVQLDLPGCDAPADLPWLRLSRTAGATGAGERTELVVTFDAAGLAPGEHRATLCVTSNDPDDPLVRVPVSLSVVADARCDRTLSGAIPGPLTISSGVTCLAAGSRVDGAVTVLRGAGLVATRAAIEGPVSALRAEMLDLWSSHVTGPVLASSGTGTISLTGSQVTGSVTLLNNQTEAVVSGNTIAGRLVCLGNQPPPTNRDQPNTVAGGGFGQCADL